MLQEFRIIILFFEYIFKNIKSRDEISMKTKTLSKILLLFLAFQAPFLTGCKKNNSYKNTISTARSNEVAQIDSSDEDIQPVKTTKNSSTKQETAEVKEFYSDPVQNRSTQTSSTRNSRSTRTAPVPLVTGAAPAVTTQHRVVTASVAGDTADWLEIATYTTGYSLIIRTYPCEQNHVYHTNAVISTPIEPINHVRYANTDAEKAIINWYDTKIPSDSNLKKRASEHDARLQMGVHFKNAAGDTSLTQNLPDGDDYPDAVGSGISQPVVSNTGGIAKPFLLSYQEAATYLSHLYATTPPTAQDSPAAAKTNFNKLIELMNAAHSSSRVAAPISIDFWLRSPVNWEAGPGDRYLISYISNNFSGSMGGSIITTEKNGVIGLAAADSPLDLVPCLWVSSNIFSDTPPTVTPEPTPPPDENPGTNTPDEGNGDNGGGTVTPPSNGKN